MTEPPLGDPRMREVAAWVDFAGMSLIPEPQYNVSLGMWCQRIQDSFVYLYAREPGWVKLEAVAAVGQLDGRKTEIIELLGNRLWMTGFSVGLGEDDITTTPEDDHGEWQVRVSSALVPLPASRMMLHTMMSVGGGLACALATQMKDRFGWETGSERVLRSINALNASMDEGRYDLNL